MFARTASPPTALDLVFTTPQSKTWDAYADIDIYPRSVPAQRRHDDDRGGVARRAVDLAARPAVRRLLRRHHPRPPSGLRIGSPTTIDEYVAKAVARARTSSRLRICARACAQRMQASPLCDARGLALELEDVYGSAVARLLRPRIEDSEPAGERGRSLFVRQCRARRRAVSAAAEARAPRARYSNLGAALRLRRPQGRGGGCLPRSHRPRTRLRQRPSSISAIFSRTAAVPPKPRAPSAAPSRSPRTTRSAAQPRPLPLAPIASRRGRAVA